MHHITFIITDLGTGGAEMMLFKLLSRLDRGRFAAEVISLIDEVPLKERIENLGVPVHVLGMARGRPDPRMVLRLARMLKASRPDLVQTWMYHADLLGGLAARLAGRAPVVWNIRNGTLEPGASRRMTVWTARVCGVLSGFVPAKIVCCANSAREIHRQFGYRDERMTVIPNGFDTEIFKPDAEARRQIREELGLREEDRVAGLVARFHPQKDFPNFIRAAALVRKELPDARFLLCGDGAEWGNEALAASIDSVGMRTDFRLLGRRTDVPRVTAALDVAVSSSACGEAFSNSLGEGMACGVPCAATEVGDAAWIVGDTGRIVPPRDSLALGAAVGGLLALDPAARKELGSLARQRIIENFALDVVAARYQELYETLLNPAAPVAGVPQLN